MTLENSKPIEVHCRIVFLNIGEIDTKNENFHALIFIQSEWDDDSFLSYFNENTNQSKSQTLYL